MSLCNPYTIALHPKYIPGCLDVMTDSSRATQINRMVTAPLSVQADLSNVVHSSYGPICHSSQPQTFFCTYPQFQTNWHGKRCSEHRLIMSHSKRLPPSQDDPENMSMQLPQNSNSSWLARDDLI